MAGTSECKDEYLRLPDVFLMWPATGDVVLVTEREANGLMQVGHGRYRSPRHRITFKSINTGPNLIIVGPKMR